MSLLMGKKLTNCSEDEAAAAITGVGLSLDLTLRDIQQDLKITGCHGKNQRPLMAPAHLLDLFLESMWVTYKTNKYGCIKTVSFSRMAIPRICSTRFFHY